MWEPDTGRWTGKAEESNRNARGEISGEIVYVKEMPGKDHGRWSQGNIKDDLYNELNVVIIMHNCYKES